jgi:hypothetical protein
MSESSTAQAPEAPKPTTGGTEPSPAVPEGFTIVPTTEAQLNNEERRLADQARGQAQLITPLVAAGVETTEDVTALLADRDALAELRRANVDVNQLVGSLKGGQPVTQDPPAQLAADTITRSEFDTARAFDRAELVHDSDTQIQDARIDTLVSELAGDGASEFQQMSVRATVKDMVIGESRFYPDDHALNKDGKIQPLEAASWLKVEKMAREGFGNGKGQPAKPAGAQATIGAGGGQGPGAAQSSEST